MIKQKPLLPPFKASIPKLLSPKNVPASQANTPSVVLPDSNQAKNPQLRASTNSDSANPESDPNNPKSSTSLYEDSFRDPRLTAFNRNVEVMRNKQVGNAAGKQTTAQSTKPKPIFLKPLDEKRLRDSLILADGGEEGAASGDVKYNPKTGKIEPRVKMETALPGVSKENSDAVDIVVGMPDDFDFEGWDSKSAKQQQQELEKAGLNRVDQMTLLNSKASLETLAMIKDISNNRYDYGLSVLDVERISKELLQISSARVGANNHDIPFLTSPATRNTFLSLLDEREQKLLSSFGYGVKGLRDKNNPYADIGNQVSDLLSGEGSIPAILHGDSDVIQVAGEFFDGMTKLGTLIENIEDGNVSFNSPAEKQRYLDYLTSAYDKNESLYRHQLASKIDDAKLLQFPETRFKELINDLSLSQLEGFVEQINENGVKMLSRPRNFENLMKDLLSDKHSALNLVADDTKSPIRPYVWNGIDVVNAEGIQISGYYYEDGVYKGKIAFPDLKPFYYKIGKKLPEEVSISVEYANWSNSQADIAWNQVTSLRAVVELIFLGLTGMPGAVRPLPEPIGPTDVPYVGEKLEEIDWSNQYEPLQVGDVFISILVRSSNNTGTEYYTMHYDPK